MTILKCKMCGGDLELSADHKIGTCTHCGSRSTRPKVDGEHQAALFNRGNALRMAGDYDKAAGMFEAMILADPTNAEAHWCLLLCRYGIEYVEDPKTQKRVPTCHRMSNDLLTSDPDYKLTLEHADGFSAPIYKEDAEKIADVQKSIIAISQNEKPYDIFICYKETPASGRGRTPESVKGQEIYDDLTNMGYRVFFARRTLENHLGTEYEPYIFAALNSAKIMLVMGSSTDNFNSVWVKNEWSRYRALMKVDRRNRNLIPCCVECDPKDLPDELAMYQAVDLDNLGALQDLMVGIKKVLGERSAPSQNSQAPLPPPAAEPAAPVRKTRTEIDYMIEECDALVSAKNFFAAAKTANRMVTHYRYDYRSWWHLIIVMTENFTKKDVEKSDLDTYFDFVERYAPDEVFPELVKTYDTYISKMSGNLSADDAIEEANRHLANKNFAKAKHFFHYATEKYPNDYRGWWGLIESVTEGFTAIMKDTIFLKTWFNKAIKTAEAAGIAIGDGESALRVGAFEEYLQNVQKADK